MNKFGFIILIGIILLFGCQSTTSSKKADLNKMAKEIYEKPDSDSGGFDVEKAKQFITEVEEYVKDNPNVGDAPEKLYLASEVSTSLRDFKKSISFLEQIIQNFPESDITKKAIFQLGFQYEDNFNNKDQALKYYNMFKNKYPDDKDLGGTIDFLIKNIDKTDEEILKEITKDKVAQ